MRIFPSWSTVMNENVGSMYWIDDRDVQPVNGVDRLPIRPRRSAQRIDAKFELGAANRIHVNDVLEIANVRQDEVFLMRGRGLDGFRRTEPA